MLTDRQVRKRFRLRAAGSSLAHSALRSHMDEKTARKYVHLGRLPSELAPQHIWIARPNPFAEVWPEVQALLEVNSGLQAKTLFQELQRRYPGRFADGQLRTLQRHIKRWRTRAEPPKEVFFAQVHEPGRLCASDFTHLTDLGVTIAGAPFPHLAYHFVLTYSNWESVTLCFSESLESLSEGLQNALGELGGVPQRHRTDRLSTAAAGTSRTVRPTCSSCAACWNSSTPAGGHGWPRRWRCCGRYRPGGWRRASGYGPGWTRAA